MNEQIEAFIVLMNKTGFPYQDVDHEMTVTGRDLEYFAELIVRECVGMLDDEDDYGPYSTGVRSAAYRIKKHFGVEE
jgi:hypothetical protein